MGTAKGKYEALQKIKGESLLKIKKDSAEFCIAPDMGGRIFASLSGMSMHRIDLDNVANPDRPFNNFGGGNFWPAPEGGKFGFNYQGDEWYVQEGINNQFFKVINYNGITAAIQKNVKLLNRLGIVMDTLMRRKVYISDIPAIFDGCNLSSSLTYITEDSFEVLNDVTVEEGLIGCWTLEQFDATKDTYSFCLTDTPQNAVNFDFYEHPEKRITYYNKGFIYHTDGGKRGQIGIKKEALAQAIGFFDSKQRLMCIRQNLSIEEGGLYFNIADNDQPDGPYSAADTLSIFNSDSDARFFELETIGSAKVDGERVLGSNLISLTSFALFKEGGDIEEWLQDKIGFQKI